MSANEKKVTKTGTVSVLWPSYEFFMFCSLFSWFTAAISTKARYAKKNYIKIILKLAKETQ